MNRNIRRYRGYRPPRRPVRRGWVPPGSGICRDFVTDRIMSSGLRENLFGTPNFRVGVEYKFLVDGPNFIVNRDRRLRNLIRGKKINGGPITIYGDKGEWEIDRSILCAGSMTIRNELSQNRGMKNYPVSVTSGNNCATIFRTCLSIKKHGPRLFLMND
jgi:hypothetical protein